MRSGRLRHRVSIQSRSQSLNSYGEPSNSFSEITGGAVWAAIESAGAREGKLADHRDEIITHNVLIRHLAGIDATHRVVFGSRVFDVVSVVNRDERDIQLELRCKERV